MSCTVSPVLVTVLIVAQLNFSKNINIQCIFRLVYNLSALSGIGLCNLTKQILKTGFDSFNAFDQFLFCMSFTTYVIKAFSTSYFKK